MSVIDVQRLKKHYGVFAAVDDISFSIDAGGIVAVLGPNGAGKTTTIEILEGFIPPDSGQVRVLGADPRRRSRSWRARIGLVLQSTSLDPQLTVSEIFSLFADVYPHPRPVAQVLELVDLVEDADTRIAALSGGQQRRVDLGLGVIGRPEILFLDEPTTGFDPAARRRCWATLDQLGREGTTVLLTTHYLDEANYLADRIIVLANGRVVADTSPDELRKRAAVSAIRYPLPTGITAEELPASLARYVGPGDRELSAQCADPAVILDPLVAWAQRYSVSLTGLEVGSPTLEDAYLALTGETASGQEGLRS